MSSVTRQAATDPPTSVGPTADDRKWTLTRIRRGIAWRVRTAVTSGRDAVLLPIAAGSGRLASAFYALASGAFNREHRGVAYGRRRFRQLATESPTHYQLRRNIHRLEKGLVMRPRRASFGANYIEETVRMYGAMMDRCALTPDSVDADELAWGGDVLSTYFGVVEAAGSIAHARSRWEAMQASQLGGSRIPYARDLSAPPPVAYDDLLALAVRRRSVRWYLDKPVPRDLIDKALEVAALSPSACNRQPFEFRVFDEPDQLRRVLAIPLGTAGFGHQVPSAAVIVGRLRAFATERDRHLIYIDGGLAAMSFVLALESLGLSSVCINWADLAPQEKEMNRLLGLEPDERVVMLVGFGFPDPDGMVAYSQKKPLSLFRRYGS
jgi:nitroreductase